MADPRAPIPPHPAIEHLIAHPSMDVSVADFAKLFRVQRITFVCARPVDVDTGLRLPSAVRGALGEPLATIARDRGDPPDQPSALQVMFADHGHLDGHAQVTKPFVIWCHTEGRHILVDISLFGEACLWRDDVIEAFTRVMLPKARGGQGGISIAYDVRARRPWPILDVYWRERGAVDVPRARPGFLMTFLSPLVLGNRTVMRGEPWRMVATLLSRLHGLARWNGLNLTAYGTVDAVEAAARLVRADPLALRATAFPRRSRSFGAMEKIETGLLGSVLVRDYPDALWPAFVLGTLTNCGYDVPQGAGRYVISDP